MDNLSQKTNLIVDILEFKENKWHVRIHLYDGDTKMVEMDRWSVKELGDPGKHGLVLVDNLGQIGDKVSIVLPVGIHDMGTNITVNKNRIDVIRRPIEEIIYETINKK